MTKDPYLNYKSKIITKDVRCLTESELERMKQKVFSSARLQRVKDIFC